MSDFHEAEGQVAAVASHAGAQAGNAEILAWRATDEQIERAECRCPLQEIIGRHVAKVHRLREALGRAGRYIASSFREFY